MALPCFLGRITVPICFFYDFSWTFQKKFVYLQPEWEGPALAEEALCTKLADGNLGNSEQELIIAGGHDGFAHSCVGLYLQFLLSGYPRTSIRNWQKQSPLLLCVEVKIETIIYNKVYEKTTKNGINNSQAPLSLATVAAGSYALYTGGL